MIEYIVCGEYIVTFIDGRKFRTRLIEEELNWWFEINDILDKFCFERKLKELK